MDFVALVAQCLGLDQPERQCGLPMLVDIGGEAASISAVVVGGEIMREAAILQRRLVGGDDDPTITGTKQRPAFGAVGRTFLVVRHLRQVWAHMRGARMRGADMENAAADAAVGF